MWRVTWFAAGRLWRRAPGAGGGGERGVRGSTTGHPRSLRRARAQAGAVRAVKQVHERAQLRVGGRDGVQQPGGLAPEHDEAVPDRAVGVLRREDGGREVVRPRDPEQVALVLLAG